MALGGGTWLVQNKVLPGTYVNYSSVSKASAALSDRGIAAAPFALDWGPEDAVFEVTSGDFQKNSKNIFGYNFNAPEMLLLREIFCHATKVLCYRLGVGGKKASAKFSDSDEAFFATARFPGKRGNDVTIVVAANVDDENAFDVSTYVGGEFFDLQTVTSAGALEDNDFVIFNKKAELTATAGLPLKGGENAEITGGSHQLFLDKIEAYSYNTLCCPAKEPATVKLYTAFCKRVRDEIGLKFQLVAFNADADYEGVINVMNESADDPESATVESNALVYWVTGAQAGVNVNASLTNSVYDGELYIDTDFTQTELEKSIKAGKLAFHKVNGKTRVLRDINSLLTLSDTKSEDFQSNQTMRVLDQIANDVAVLFGTRYVGNVPNDADGRGALWNDVVALIRQLEKLRAVENFDPDTLKIELGETKKAVLLTMNGLFIVNAMEQLYVAIIIK